MCHWHPLFRNATTVEQIVSIVPKIICQGLGRAARIAYLRDIPGCGGNGLGGIPTADALNEVCRHAADFARDHPSYPSFVYSLLAEAVGTSDNADSAYSESFPRRSEWSDAPTDGSGAGRGKRRFASSGDVNSGIVAGKESRDPGVVPVGRIDAGLIGNERQRHQWRQWHQSRRRHEVHTPDVLEDILPNATPVTARVNGCSSGDDGDGTAEAHLLPTNLIAGAAVGKHGEADAAAELLASAENELVVAERALGAAMSAIARETGGKEAAALLVLNGRCF